MSEDVRAEAGVRERGVGRLGLVFAKDPGDPAAAGFRLVLVEEHRVLIAAGAVQLPFGEVGGQQRCGVVADRDVTGLAALPVRAAMAGSCRRMSPTVRSASSWTLAAVS
jgi:hypothetical protein